MGWFLGCFKYRQRRRNSSSINLTNSCEDGRRSSSSTGLLSANSAQAKESVEVERIFSVKGDHSNSNSSVCIQTDRRNRSARRPSSELLLQVEKLEEGIDSLNRKLSEEAAQATSLTNEVRHLRSCSQLLDSPNAFRKAFDSLEHALEEGHVEESQPLLYLQSLLSLIEPSEAVVEASTEERDDARSPKGLLECMDVPCMMTKKEWKSSINAYGEVKEVELDQSQVSVLPSLTTSRELDEGQQVLPKDEQSTCNLSQRHFSGVGDIDAKKSPLITEVKQRSSTTLSFSGFLVVEDVTEERSSSDMAAVEQLSSTQLSLTKIIEKTDLSSENLTEASKSLFAFLMDSSQGHSTPTVQALFGETAMDFSCPKPGLVVVDPRSEKPHSKGSFVNLHYRSPTLELEGVPYTLSMEQCQVDANGTSYNGFSDVDALSLLSTSGSSSVDCISSSSLDSEDMNSQHGIEASSLKVSCQMHVPSILDKIFAEEHVNTHATVQTLSLSQPEDISDAAAPLKVLDHSISNEEGSQYKTSHMTKLSSPGITSIWSPDTETSPYVVHTFSPLQPGGDIKEGCSGFLSEIPSTPLLVDLLESRLPFASKDARKLQFTPLRTPIASLAQAETPSTIHSQGSHSSLDEERPILGTVAAHWNHSLSASMQKGWDGKGIPNSTNKYKEDQKVSWHATPFEVRLERALANQGRVLQKKLFTGAMATEVEVSM